MIQCTLNWFKDNSDAVTGIASVAGVIIAFVGFWLTVQQLRQAQTALKASNMYTIQKDARELITAMMANKSFDDFVVNHESQKKYSKSTTDEAYKCLAVMFNFYLSIFRQFKTKGISQDFSNSIGRDFSNFMSKEAVRSYYNRKRESQDYDEEHQAMVDLWDSPQGNNSRS